MAGCLVLLLVTLSGAGAAAGPAGTPDAGADWLSQLNFYRQAAGLPTVSEDAHASAASLQHARYIVFSGRATSRPKRTPPARHTRVPATPSPGRSTSRAPTPRC